MLIDRRWFFITLLFWLATPLAAQEYPTKPVRIIVPFPASGVADVLARMVAQRLGETWGQQILVENRPGANTIIGADAVAKAQPDGYTLLLTSDQTVTINQHLYPKLPFDPEHDFAPVTNVAVVPLMLTVHSSIPAQTMRELVDYARARPGQLNYGSSGIGSPQHLTMELFKSQAGINITHVPYKGGAPATTAIVAGEIQTIFGGVSNLLPHVKTGKVRALAVSTGRRSQAAPQLPSVAESGLPGFDVGVWLGLFAPRGTPDAVIAKLQAATARIILAPELKEQLAAQGFDPLGSSTEEFRQTIRRDTEKWSKLIRALGIKGEGA